MTQEAFRQESQVDKVRRAMAQATQRAAEEEPQEPWNDCLIRSMVSARALESLAISPRLCLIENWLMEGDLGFIFATRGLGKTWLGIHLANCIAEARPCGPWKIAKAQKVFYMDGEMPLEEVQRRDRILGNQTENLTYLSHELVFERTGRILNLADPLLQYAILELTTSLSFKVLILDNLSTLVSGVEENKAIDWEKLLPWLLKLRRAHITVIFIHHAGVSTDRMRGTTKREDAASWVINLKEPIEDPGKESPGAHFISSFQKCRNGAKRPENIKWTFDPLPNGEIDVQHQICTALDVFLELVAHDVCQGTDIAEAMDVSRATVSRLAQKAENRDFIEIKNRRYYIKTSKSTHYNPSADWNDP